MSQHHRVVLSPKGQHKVLFSQLSFVLKRNWSVYKSVFFCTKMINIDRFWRKEQTVFDYSVTIIICVWTNKPSFYKVGHSVQVCMVWTFLQAFSKEINWFHFVQILINSIYKYLLLMESISIKRKYSCKNLWKNIVEWLYREARKVLNQLIFLK